MATTGYVQNVQLSEEDMIYDNNVTETTRLLGASGNSGTSVQGSRKRQVIAALTACLSAVSCGFVLGYSSPTIPGLLAAQLITRDQESWFGSLINIGALCGGPIAGLLVEFIGRKGMVMFCSLPFMSGWLMLAFARGYLLLYFGRILCGVGLGMSCLCVPIYIGETASKELRGTLGSCFQLFITLGVLFAYVLGMYLNWVWLALVSASCAALTVTLMFWMPETPRWLLAKKQHVAALKALTWLHGPNFNVEEECKEIEENLLQQAPMSIREFNNPQLYKPLLIALGIMLFQQIGGINAIIFYASDIFDTAGFKNPSLPAIIVGSVQVIATFIASMLVDRTGRRALLLTSGAAMAVSSVALGAYYYVLQVKHAEGLSWLSVVSVNVYIAGFSLGWGPIPWIITAEVFPVNARGIAAGMAVLVSWSSSFLVTQEFQQLQDSITTYGTFWLFGGICFVGVFFTAVFLPETKGRSLEDIQRSFAPNRALAVVIHTEH